MTFFETKRLIKSHISKPTTEDLNSPGRKLFFLFRLISMDVDFNQDFVQWTISKTRWINW